MAKAGKSGVTTNTPDHIILGAGTIHKNLKEDNNWANLEESIIGATKGGSTLSIAPEFHKIEADGSLVPVKGLTFKVGEAATLTVNFLEITKELLKLAVVGKDGTSANTEYDVIETKADIEEGDYLENIAFVGKTAKGKKIIVILYNALCTSGLELEGKNKEEGIVKLVFESHAELDGAHDTVGVKVYYPKETE